MASVSLLKSAASSVRGQCRSYLTKRTSFFPFAAARVSGGPVLVRASSGVAETNRPVLEGEEFAYTSFNQASFSPLFIQKFSYKNLHEIPKVEKVVVRSSLGQVSKIETLAAMKELSLITGQMPTVRKGADTYKLSDAAPVLIFVTLRRDRMHYFLDRLINLEIPRVCEGVDPVSFDGHGNFHIGFHEDPVFQEIRFEPLGTPKGIDVHIDTTAKTDIEAFTLLSLMGMPFREGADPTKLTRKKKKKPKIEQFKKKERR